VQQEAEGIERFQAKACPGLDPGWKPVRIKKTRQIKKLEPRFDSIEAGLEAPTSRCRRARAERAMSENPFSLWVYLSQSPLLWLTVTLLVYAIAASLATHRHPLANLVASANRCTPIRR
jgi:hypothetical protein